MTASGGTGDSSDDRKQAWEDELATFDMDLAEALLERDGVLPEYKDFYFGDLPLSDLEREVLLDALERYISQNTGDPTFGEDADHARHVHARMDDLTVKKPYGELPPPA